jgi:hypothetical protein
VEVELGWTWNVLGLAGLVKWAVEGKVKRNDIEG